MLLVIIALVAGAIAAVISEIGVYSVPVSAVFGYLAGTALLKTSGMNRMDEVQALAGVGMFAGALLFNILPRALWGTIAVPIGHSWIDFGMPSLFDEFLWIALLVTVVAALVRIRFCGDTIGG
jgi:hypothetical protein